MMRRYHTNATHWTRKGLRIEHSGAPVTVIRDLFIQLPSIEEQQHALDLLQKALQKRREREAAKCPETTP